MPEWKPEVWQEIQLGDACKSRLAKLSLQGLQASSQGNRCLSSLPFVYQQRNHEQGD